MRVEGRAHTAATEKQVEVGQGERARTFSDSPNGDGAKKVTILSSRRKTMQISAPKQITFWIAVVIAVVGVLAKLVSIPVLSGLALWLVVIAFIVLAAGNLVEGL